MLKASKTLDDTFIGSVHESISLKKDYSSEIQGLPGRLCGWGKKKGTHGVKIYCNQGILERYIELYNSNFNYEKENFEWRDNKLKINLKGKVNSKQSYLFNQEESINSELNTEISYS